MRRMARAKADKMSKPVSPTSSIQTIDQITEEERQEILKYVETEQTEVGCNKLFHKIGAMGSDSLLL